MLLLVDGYNCIGAFRELNGYSLEDARDKLLDILADYAGFTGQRVVCVFDAHKSGRLARSSSRTPAGVDVVFTKSRETADHYIERMVDALMEKGRPLRIRVATSDLLEQSIILSRGAVRVSSRELIREIKEAQKGISDAIAGMTPVKRHPFDEQMDDAVRAFFEENRRHTKRG